MIVDRPLPLPIERIGDVSSHFEPFGHDSKSGFDAWIRGANEQSRYIRHVRETDELTRELTDGLAFWSDVANVMHGRAAEEHPRYLQHDDEHEDIRQEWINEAIEKFPDDGILESILDGSRNFGDDELISIVEAHFGAVEGFLRTGDGRRFFSENIEYVRDQVGDWDEAHNLGAMIPLGNFFDEQEEEPLYGKRMNVVVRNMGMLYAEYRLMGRAIALLSVMDDTDEIEKLMSIIVDGMCVDKAEYGEEYYQRDYAYANNMLHGDTLWRFREILQPVVIPRIEGSDRSYERWGDKVVIIDKWDEQKLITAATTKGDKVELPFTEYRQRAIMDQGKVNGSSTYDRRYSILLEELDGELLSKVEAKLAEVDGDTTETPVVERDEPIERLVFGFGFSLKTMDVSKGKWEIMPCLSPEQIVDDRHDNGDVSDIEEIGDVEWLVTPSCDGYVQEETFTQDDIARFAPEGANAFWPVGTPRVVRRSKRQVDDQGPHVVLTPIKFYRIEKVDDY